MTVTVTPALGRQVRADSGCQLGADAANWFTPEAGARKARGRPDTDVIPPPDVLAAVDRIAASEPFVNASRLTRLLRYLVHRSLQGEADQLKEYVVGVDVFDRRDDYDPRIDSIVRVEARRLRSKLDEYYRGRGADDPIHIEVPRGAYAAVFRSRARAEAPPHATTADGSPSANQHSRLRWWPAAAVVTGAVIVLTALVARSPSVPAVRLGATTAPSIAVLPFETFSTDPADVLLAARITDAVTTGLARLGSVAVASRTSAARYASVEARRGVAAELGVDFVMEASAVMSVTGLRIEARLVDGASDRKVWVRGYDASRDGIDDLARRLAADAAGAVLERTATR